MNEYNHVSVIECPKCGQKAEIDFIHILDSKENAYEKQLLLNGTMFDHKCAQCGEEITLVYETTYVDPERNIEVYLVNEDHVDGALMMLVRTDAVYRKYHAAEEPKLIKRIVMCHHQLREKVMIFEEGLDDRVIEIIKLICMNEAMRSMPDLDPVSAEFDVKDGKRVINVYGEEYSVTSPIPDGLYNHIASDFKDALTGDHDYLVNEVWAMEAMGVDPFDDMDCDGDCAHCPHNCDECDDIDIDFEDDDFDDCDRCEDCNCKNDCENCPCDNCASDIDCAECENVCPKVCRRKDND